MELISTSLGLDPNQLSVRFHRLVFSVSRLRAKKKKERKKRRRRKDKDEGQCGKNPTPIEGAVTETPRLPRPFLCELELLQKTHPAGASPPSVPRRERERERGGGREGRRGWVDEDRSRTTRWACAKRRVPISTCVRKMRERMREDGFHLISSLHMSARGRESAVTMVRAGARA